MKTFLFYDIETSGLNPAFDQVLTFASIRTDLNLNEIERLAITIRLREDIIPSPRAFLTHGLTFAELEKGMGEYDAAKKIHHEVNTPGTISLGYNSLGFDDVFLRFLFYRNLFDPYMHQYSQGCSRMDILPIAVIYWLFYPTVLKWPQNEGKPSLKLELISNENSFETTGRAHEAMNDVEAVIALSRAFFQNKDIWEYALGFFNKTREDVRINNIQKDFSVQGQRFKICLMLSAAFGPDQNYMRPVLHLGESDAYKNQSLWLRMDADDVLGLTGDLELSETMVIRKKSADAHIILPALDRFWARLPDASRNAVMSNTEIIEQNWKRFFELIQYHREFKYPFVPEMDQDAALYQEGFFTAAEKKDIRLFHQADGEQKHCILNRIKSNRIKQLAARILARNFKGNLSRDAQKEFGIYLDRLKSSLPENQIVGYKKDAKYNLKSAQDEFIEVEKSLADQNEGPDEDQKQMMAWLKEYLEIL